MPESDGTPNPTPWRVHVARDGVFIEDATGVRIADIDIWCHPDNDAPAIAERICDAVNKLEAINEYLRNHEGKRKR